MVLKINNQNITFWNSFTLHLKYDSVADAFAFVFYFDPNNALHKQLFRPLQYQVVQIFEGNELLITGTVLNTHFENSAEKKLAKLEGYSISGIIEDCQVTNATGDIAATAADGPAPAPNDAVKPASLIFGEGTAFDTLYNVAQKLIAPFNLQMYVNPDIAADMNAPLPPLTTISEDKTIKEILQELCLSKNITISHDQYGVLLFDRINTGATNFAPGGGPGNVDATDTSLRGRGNLAQAPVYSFTDTSPETHIALSVNGQNIHSQIMVAAEAWQDSPDGAIQTTIAGSGDNPIKNPYVPIFRPMFTTKTRGKNISASDAARHYLGEELKSIKLTITISQWQLKGAIIRPASIVMVTSPENFIYKATRFFVMEVMLKGDQKDQTAVIVCCLPEVFNNDPITNIFK
jgi:prophage tail gpP-like protein